jgi:hypothetical protein
MRQVVANLAGAGKSYTEIKEMVYAMYGEMLSKKAMFVICRRWRIAKIPLTRPISRGKNS